MRIIAGVDDITSGPRSTQRIREPYSASPSAVDLNEEHIHWDLSEAMLYGDYLALDTLLACQNPRTDHHDEVLFIVMHPASELWIKLCLHEVSGAIRQIRSDELGPAFKMLARLGRVQANLIQSWEILSTMTPSDYGAFRGALGKSSGFQSFQYRILEYRLGNKNRAAARVFASHAHIAPEVETALVEPNLYDEALALLARRGFAIPREKINRDFAEPYVTDPTVREAWRQV